MALTDKIIFFAGLFFFWRGWSKGFLNTLLGPAALIIGTLLSFIYYLLFHNIIIAVAIGIIAPILLKIFFSMTLGVILLGDGKKHLSLLSRFIGGLINTVWGEFLLITGIIMLLLIPFKFTPLNDAQTDIQHSGVFTLIKPSLDQMFGQESIAQYDPAKFVAFSDPKVIEALEESKEFHDLMDTPQIQDLLNDPVANEQIENKNIAQLVQNPKFIALTKDPELLKKFLALYGAMMKIDTTKTGASNNSPLPSEPQLEAQ